MSEGDSLALLAEIGQERAIPTQITSWTPSGIGRSHQGLEGQQEPPGAAFTGLPCPTPGRGITASRRRFG